MRRCEEAALGDEHIEAMALHVSGDNGAGRKLYEACGYELVTRRSEWRGLLGINDSGAGLELMVKRLRPSMHAVSTGCPPPTAPSDA